MSTLLFSLSPFLVSLWVTLTWAPRRLQRGPHTGRGAKPAGLVNGRTRLLFDELSTLLSGYKKQEPNDLSVIGLFCNPPAEVQTELARTGAFDKSLKFSRALRSTSDCSGSSRPLS